VALQVARFNTPNIWDVAGGIALFEAAGGPGAPRAEQKKAHDAGQVSLRSREGRSFGDETPRSPGRRKF
jgi:hypothetical protein